MNIHELNNILLNHNKQYQNFWSNVMEPNQREINNTTDYNERKILQATQDKIAIYINEQSDLIEYLVTQLAKAPSKSELDFYKRYVTHARYYITQLGGSPSILNHIKDTDLC